MVDVICLGELLIDFVSMDQNISLKNSSMFVKSPGGAPANVAVGVSKLGRSSGFIGKVGEDPFGHFLQEVLTFNGVDTSLLKYDTEARTTLSFVAFNEEEERNCMFYRNPGADMRLGASDIQEDYFINSSIFHFGSISMSENSCEEATLKALAYAKKHNLIISYDPNLRSMLWRNDTLAREKICQGFNYADIVKISEEEMEFITGVSDIERSAEKILSHGCNIVIVSMGSRGCYYSDGTSKGYLKGNKVATVETTGAGDAFVAATLYRILQRMDQGENQPLKMDADMIDALEFANYAGALATTKMGAIPGLPTLMEIQTLRTLAR